MEILKKESIIRKDLKKPIKNSAMIFGVIEDESDEEDDEEIDSEKGVSAAVMP